MVKPIRAFGGSFNGMMIIPVIRALPIIYLGSPARGFGLITQVSHPQKFQIAGMTRADIKFLRQNNKATGFDRHHPSRLVQTGTEEVYPADFTTHQMVCMIVDEMVPLWKSESLYFALKILYRLTHSKASDKIRGAKLETLFMTVPF